MAKKKTSHINNVVEAINKGLKLIDRNYILTKRDIPLLYELNGDGIECTNDFDNNRKVYLRHWFDRYWIYMCVKFKEVDLQEYTNTSQKKYNALISVSFFYQQDTTYKQLFRAEWDEYEKMNHPQPHWHFTIVHPSQIMSWQDLNDIENDDFSELRADNEKLHRESPEIVNIPLQNMHFAMCQDINGVENEYTESNITNWVKLLFKNIRTELEYLKE